MNLDEMSLTTLQELLQRAERLLADKKRQQGSTLQRELAQAARAAGLSAEEWRILVGGSS